MLLKSFSKINLTLQVNKKVKNNSLHDIQSYYCLIDLHDSINIKKIYGRKDIVKFHGGFAKYINVSKNSIKNTLYILRKNNLIINYYSVLIKKNVPIFAGLGGGTSNAAYLAKYLLKDKIGKNILDILSKKIGSDYKLFSYNQGFVANLNTISKSKKKYSLFFVLVYPNIRCSTQYIYSKITEYSSKSAIKDYNINTKQKFMKFLIEKNNDLQKVVEKKYPIIKRILKDIGQLEGCYFSRLTGSGSVCYGVFKSRKAAKSALSKVKLKYPKYWSSFAKTI